MPGLASSERESVRQQIQRSRFDSAQKPKISNVEKGFLRPWQILRNSSTKSYATKLHKNQTTPSTGELRADFH